MGHNSSESAKFSFDIVRGCSAGVVLVLCTTEDPPANTAIMFMRAVDGKIEWRATGGPRVDETVFQRAKQLAGQAFEDMERARMQPHLPFAM